MSNKETLQNHNSRLKTDNIDLTSILELIDKIPENVEIKLQEKTVTPTIEQQEVVADEGYTGLSKVTVEEIADLTGEITNQGELITVQKTTIEDIVESLKNKAGVNNKLQEKTVTPSIEQQEVVADEEYFGLSKVTVSGDENLVAENIKEGTSIFGVEGSLKASTSSAKITDASYLFYNGARLSEIEECLALCNEVTKVTSMFQGCTTLQDLDLSNVDCSKVTGMQSVFNACSNLTNLKFFKNVGKGYTLQYENYSALRVELASCTKLTHESLMDVINNLYDLNLTYDVAGGKKLYMQGLVLGSTNLAKLTAEEIAIATNKGWIVS